MDRKRRYVNRSLRAGDIRDERAARRRVRRVAMKRAIADHVDFAAPHRA